MTRIVLIEDGHTLPEETIQKVRELLPDAIIALSPEEAIALAPKPKVGIPTNPRTQLALLQAQLAMHPEILESQSNVMEIKRRESPDPVDYDLLDTPETTPKAAFIPPRSMRLKNKIRRKRK